MPSPDQNSRQRRRDPGAGREVIRLSQVRAEIARARRARRGQALLDAPDPAAAVQALAPHEFFHVVHEMGFPEALDVLRHARAEQVQVALDFAIWDRDRVDPAHEQEWLAALADAPYEAIGAWMRGLDVELVALLLRRRARIADVSIDEPPDAAPGAVFSTPDGLFQLELLGNDDDRQVTARIVDALYRDDAGFARRLLVGARSELDSDLEETAYRWRSARMADLGFIDFYEALAVYHEIDPDGVRPGDGPAPRLRATGDGPGATLGELPGALSERLAGATPFADALAGLDGEALSDLRLALLALGNRVLAADRIEPGDQSAVAETMARMVATLDIAVEFLARGDAERARAALRGVPLVRLHQLGWTLVCKVRRLARTVLRDNVFAHAAPLHLFETGDDEVLEALTRARPVFPRILDTPRAGGTRPLSCLADLARAAAAVERAGAALSLLVALGLEPAHLAPGRLAALGVSDPAEIDTGLLARTLLVPRLLGRRQAALARLGPMDLRAFEKKFAEPIRRRRPSSRNHTPIVDRVRAVFGAAGLGAALTDAMDSVARRWAESLVPLGAVLAGPARRPRRRSAERPRRRAPRRRARGKI